MKNSSVISVPLTPDEINLITKAMSDGLNYRKLGLSAIYSSEFSIILKLKALVY